MYWHLNMKFKHFKSRTLEVYKCCEKSQGKPGRQTRGTKAASDDKTHLKCNKHDNNNNNYW